FFFFFQAEDGIRDFHVTGVQTCALPISDPPGHPVLEGQCPPAGSLERADGHAGHEQSALVVGTGVSGVGVRAGGVAQVRRDTPADEIGDVPQGAYGRHLGTHRCGLPARRTRQTGARSRESDTDSSRPCSAGSTSPRSTSLRGRGGWTRSNATSTLTV